LLILPNPNNGLFEIQSQYNENGKIKISNIVGTVVYESEEMGHTIDLTNLSKGVYTVEFSNTRQILKGKVIIQ
jgi:hypothetical protein